MSTAKSEFAILRKTKKGVIFMLIVGGGLLALVLWAVISFSVSVAQKRDLIQHGVKTNATVTAKHSEFVALRSGGFNTYSVDYTFTEGGHTVTKQNATISHQSWQNLSVDSNIEVVYKPGDASDSQPVTAVATINPMASVIIYFAVSLPLLVGISALVKKYVPVKKQKSFWWFIGIIVVSFFGGFWITVGLARLISLLLL